MTTTIRAMTRAWWPSQDAADPLVEELTAEAPLMRSCTQTGIGGTGH
jgi:hypothetical protein